MGKACSNTQCKRAVVEMLRGMCGNEKSSAIWHDAADAVAAMPVEEDGNYPELYADCLAALAAIRQRLEKAEELLREARFNTSDTRFAQRINYDPMEPGRGAPANRALAKHVAPPA